MSDDSEYEEEEFLVYADFKNQLMPGEITEATAIKIIGIDSQPVAEINGNIFKGTYDFAMGTDVFFEKDPDAPPPDPLFETSCKQKYKYVCKTNKVINFQRIFVESKAPTTAATTETKADVDTHDAATTSNALKEESLRVTMSYDEAIRQFPAVPILPEI